MLMEKINGQDDRKAAYYQSAVNEKPRGKQESDKDKQQDGGNTIYAGDLELGQNDLLAKKDRMKKNALKVLTEAFTNDQKIDDSVDKHRSKAEAMEKEAAEATGEMKRIGGLKQELKGTYGITDDSQEQKDLELLEKKGDIDKGFSNATLTKEEEERINSMGPVTEYQQAALDYHGMELTWRKRLGDANDTIEMEHKTINTIQLDRLKTHPIVDAHKDSKKLLDAAGKELIGGLMEEAKENIDEKIGDNTDEEEEIKNKDKKQQEETAQAEKADKKKEEKKAKQYKDNTMPDEPGPREDIDWERLHRQVKAAADKENLLNEDLKGLTVDEQL